MSNDITSGSDESNNLNDKEEEPANPEVLKDRLNTLKRVCIYALFLFVKICCFIFINANIIYYFTYLFERIYYKDFTLGNSNKKTVMVDQFSKELDDLFPSDRTKYPYLKNQHAEQIGEKIKEYIGLNIHDNPLLTCPPKPNDNPSGAGAGAAAAGTSEKFKCDETKGSSCTGAGRAPGPGSGEVSAASSEGQTSGEPLSTAPQSGEPPLSTSPTGVSSGGQKGGAVQTLITNINNLSKKILEGVKPVARVKKDITELYKGKGSVSGSESGSVSGSGSGSDKSTAHDDDKVKEKTNKDCADTKRKPVILTTCEEVDCDTLPAPYGWKFPENFFGDYIRIRIACMGRSQIAIYHKVKNTIKKCNNFLGAFCYCSEEETKFLSGYERPSGKDENGHDFKNYAWANEATKETWFKNQENIQVKRTDPATECIAINDFYNGLYMIFGIFISMLYLIYWDLYLNITLFINHILLFFEIKKAPETHIKTKYRRTLQFLILMMSPFIFITNRVVAFIIMIQITYKLWVQPLLHKTKKKRVGEILLKNKTIIAFMFVFAYLLLLYTIELPPKYELPVKIIPTLVITIIVFIKVILAIYRFITNYKFNQTKTCKTV